MTPPEETAALERGPLPPSDKLFDPAEFGAAVAAKLGDRSYRQAAPTVPISTATLHRVASGKVPDVETYLRLIRWLTSADEPDPDLARRAEAAKWQDISTAPKDGTVVDLWKVAPDGRHGRRIADVRWDNNRSFNGGFARVALPDAWVHAAHRGEVYLDGGTFTHWRPLPEPPSARALITPIAEGR